MSEPRPLTPYRIFEPELVCSGCKRPLPDAEDDIGDVCRCPEYHDLEERRYRRMLPGALDVADIHLRRCGPQALVDVEQRYVWHSPTGFEWGYGGSGPADLALNILGLFLPAPEAWRLHHRYKAEVLAVLPREGRHTITAAGVRDWILDQWILERKAQRARGAGAPAALAGDD